MGKKLTTQEFIEKAKLIHGNKYDYSKVIYSRSSEKSMYNLPKTWRIFIDCYRTS